MSGRRTLRALYLVSVWIHVLAASVWVGGMAFLVLVVVPWLRAKQPSLRGALLRDTGKRFSQVGWTCFGVLVVTGSFNLYARGVRLVDLANGEWWTAPFGKALAMKLSLFGLVCLLSAVHDFRMGPRASQALEREPDAPRSRALRSAASRLGRLNALLALLLVALGVVLVRGFP